jgi:nicotinate-nucleotide adenylyltransferase
LLFTRQKRGHTTGWITQVTGLYGGVFDPPHNGHVAVARAALEHFDPQQLLVLVVVDPGHKPVELDFEARYGLAHLAFDGLPRTQLHPEGHARTADALREHHFADAIFFIGADEFTAFPAWRDPDEVLRRTRLGVATRPGYPQEAFENVLAQLEQPERVEFFEIPAVDVSSSEVRRRIRAGEPIAGLVPDAVAREIEGAGLYR